VKEKKASSEDEETDDGNNNGDGVNRRFSGRSQSTKKQKTIERENKEKAADKEYKKKTADEDYDKTDDGDRILLGDSGGDDVVESEDSNEVDGTDDDDKDLPKDNENMNEDDGTDNDDKDPPTGNGDSDEDVGTDDDNAERPTSEEDSNEDGGTDNDDKERPTGKEDSKEDDVTDDNDVKMPEWVVKNKLNIGRYGYEECVKIMRLMVQVQEIVVPNAHGLRTRRIMKSFVSNFVVFGAFMMLSYKGKSEAKGVLYVNSKREIDMKNKPELSCIRQCVLACGATYEKEGLFGDYSDMHSHISHRRNVYMWLKNTRNSFNRFGSWTVQRGVVMGDREGLFLPYKEILEEAGVSFG